jgi:HlyD family secretion protein
MSALFRSGEEWSVFTIDGGRAERRTIQIGRRNGFEAEVIDGLRPGERVITHPSDALKDNGRVAPRS